MAWYHDIASKHSEIYEIASNLAWESTESLYPLVDRYEYDEGCIYVSGWSSVNCCGDVIPLPDPSSRAHKLVLKDELVEKIAIDAGFRKGDWFWENVLENWHDSEAEFHITVKGCEPVLEYDQLDVSDWIDHIRVSYLGHDNDLVAEFGGWLSDDDNYDKLVDFASSLEDCFSRLGDRLIEYIKNFVDQYNEDFEYYIADLAARKVAENLADSYQIDFVKTCSAFYKDGGTIPGAVFVVVRDRVWEDFLASELGTEISNEDYEALDRIRDHYLDILVEFLDYPQDLVNVVGSLFVGRR